MSVVHIEPSPCKGCDKDCDGACLEWKQWFLWTWPVVCKAVREVKVFDGKRKGKRGEKPKRVFLSIWDT